MKPASSEAGFQCGWFRAQPVISPRVCATMGRTRRSGDGGERTHASWRITWIIGEGINVPPCKGAQRPMVRYHRKVQDAEWDEMERRLVSQEAGALAALIPRKLVETAMGTGSDHPLARLFLEPSARSVVLTSRALARIAEWLKTPAGIPHQPWWDAKIKLLPGDDAAGTLAEMRAFGALLPTPDTIGDGLDVRPYSAKGKAPDFRIGHDDDAVFVEVCCARMNDDERDRLEDLDAREASMSAKARDAAVEALGTEPGSTVRAIANAEWDSETANPKLQRHQVTVDAIRQDNGRPLFLTTSVRVIRPHGAPKPEGDTHTIASRLAGKKIPGQVPSGKAGILWMDLCDPDWAMSVDNTRPAELMWKGLSLATTRGIWHAFYGEKDKTPMMERSAISFADGGHSSSRQVFDGRFRTAEQRCWSIAVLRCTDGIVLFEHPNPEVRIPFSILRELVGIEGYAPDMSIHRFAEDEHDGVSRRLEDVERMLAFYAA